MINQQLLHPTQLSGLNGFRSKPTKTMNKAYQAQRQKQQAAAAGPYTLSMSFCVDEVNTVIDKYRAETGLQDAEQTPEHVAYSVYHGDLIICLKNILIPLEQEWHLGVDSHYYNAETDDVMTVPVQFQMPKMSFNEFKFGSTLAVDRVRSDAKLTCVTGFTNYECLKEFNFVKKVIRNSGLEGIKKVNEAIQTCKNIEQVA